MTTGQPRTGGPAYAVVYDIDAILRIAPLRRQWGRLRALATRGPHDRRSQLGHAAGAADAGRGRGRGIRLLPDGPADPARPPAAADPAPRPVPAGHGADGRARHLHGLVLRRRSGDQARRARPARGPAPGHHLRARGRRRRPRPPALRRLRPRPPGAGRGDRAAPARRRRRRPGVGRPGRRRARRSSRPRTARSCCPGCATALGIGPTRGRPRIEDWFLTRRRARQPGDPAAGVDRGQRRAPAGARERLLPRAHRARWRRPARGDLVLFGGWRGDGDEQLGRRRTDGRRGPHGARRGAGPWCAGCCGARTSRCSATTSRRTAGSPRRSSRAGGEVLLDQRIRPLGSHHQKIVVAPAPRTRPTTSRTSAASTSSSAPATTSSTAATRSRRRPSDEYTRSPRHDVQVRAARAGRSRDLDDVFRERWDDPAPLARLPWHVVPDRLHGLLRRGSPLPAPAPDPPPAGTVRDPDPAHLSPPAARAPVRPARRAQHRPRVHQGAGPGAAAGLRRGPVPVVRSTSRACSPPRCAAPRGCS